MASTVRQFSGAVMRGDIAWVDAQGLREGVRARVPPETQRLIDKPPLPISWIDAQHVDALLSAVLELGGEEKVVQLGLETTRSSFGPVLRPLVKTLMKLFGASPGVLLRNIDSVLPTFLRGVSFTYESRDAFSGRLHLRSADVPCRAFLITWLGTLQFAFEVSQAPGGRIEGWTADADGKGAIYELGWSGDGQVPEE